MRRGYVLLDVRPNTLFEQVRPQGFSSQLALCIEVLEQQRISSLVLLSSLCPGAKTPESSPNQMRLRLSKESVE